MADEKISQLADAGTPQDTDQLVLARSGSTLSLLFSSLKAAIPGGVTSVFTRTGAVTAQTGDYTAAQVTNAADKSSSSQQNFTGELKSPDFAAGGLTGATAVSRYVGATTSGAPASGTFAVGDFVVARNGHIFVCTVAGSPGTWVDVGSVANAVTSVFSRTGAVTAQSGDYNLNQIGAATGDYSINSHKLTNLTDPTAAQDAATKNYVDNATPGNGGGKGHLTTATAVNSPADLAPGSDGTVLTADSTQSVGLKWATVGGTGLTLLYSNVLGSAGLFDTGAGGIPSGHQNLIIIGNMQLSSAVTSGAIWGQVNNDGGANYDLIDAFWAPGGSSGSTSAATAWSFAGLVGGSTNPFNYAGTFILVISDYNNTTYAKSGFSVVALPGSRLAICVLGWRSTAAISRFALGGGTVGTPTNFAAGSSLYVYGTQ